jgi:hypothetical protein
MAKKKSKTATTKNSKKQEHTKNWISLLGTWVGRVGLLLAYIGAYYDFSENVSISAAARREAE